MTLDEAIKHAEEVAYQKDMQSGFYTDNERYAMTNSERAECKECAAQHRQLAEWLKELKALRAETRWISMVRREPTEEEKTEYLARNGEELYYMLENKMPLNGQEVLVSSGKFVSADVFNEEFYNFECHDIEYVDAWRPLPKPYKAESEDK